MSTFAVKFEVDLIKTIMKMKISGKLFFLLTATLVLAASPTLTACSDNDDGDSNAEETEQSTMPADANDDATVLGSLLATWVDDFTSQDVTPGILNLTFEATVGTITDESRPADRTIVVGTVEAADEYACQTLRLLGIGSAPNGFTWHNAAIGDISYEHGAANSNELGVIYVNVKQLPLLKQIILAKEHSVNANKNAFYQKGDIVRYSKDEKFYICVNDHSYGEEAIWLSFDCADDIANLSTGTCGWMGAGDDIVYNKEQARPDYLRMWLQEFLISNDGYESVITHMKNQPAKAINQIVPSTKDLRNKLIGSLIYDSDDVLLELNQVVGDENELRVEKQDVNYDVIKSSGSTETRRYNPVGLLLSGSMRWSMHLTTWDYWQPYIVLIPESDHEASTLNELLQNLPSMNEDASHFKWATLRSGIKYDDKNYSMTNVALHWTHTAYQSGNKKLKMLVNFTKNERTIEGGQPDYNNVNDLDWTLRNITSRYLSVKDKGENYKYFTDIYRNSNASPNIPKDDETVKVGYLIGTDGKFYVNKAAAENAGIDPIAMVVYKGQAYSVEKGQPYNCLAIALDDIKEKIGLNNFKDKYSWGDFNSCSVACTETNLQKDDIYLRERLLDVCNGMAMTERLARAKCNNNHQHEAAYAVYMSKDPIENEKFSSWFIPSVGQVSKAMEGQGYTSFEEGNIFRDVKWMWEAAGCEESALNGFYFTTTEYSTNYVFTFTSSVLNEQPKIMMEQKIRPFLAFTAN